MEKLPISVVILTKNEEKNIERVLLSVRFADDIVVIDDNSEDSTCKIAMDAGAMVYKRSLEGDFAAQRNYGIEQAKHDWILCIDADEEVTSELKEEISSLVILRERSDSKDLLNQEDPLSEGNIRIQDKKPNVNYKAFRIKRRDFWWGRELKFGETQKVRNKGLLRLFHKHSGTWKGQVHETFVTKTQTSLLSHFINHYPHQTLKEFIFHVNKYSTLRAQELFRQKKKTNTVEIIGLPMCKFILNYILYLGFLDGPAGFTYSFMMSFHSFLVRAKLYQYWNYPTK